MAAKQFGLGKGLGALIPDNVMEPPSAPPVQGELTGAPGTAEPRGDGVRSVPLKRVAPNPGQPRKSFSDEGLAELAESIKLHGVIQPLIVEDDGAGGFRIVAGERRWRACGIAGLKDVPVIVRSYSDEKRLEIALIENVQREDLNPVEEAEAYKALMSLTGCTQEEAAAKVGKSRPAVANALRILKLPAEALQSVRDGALSAGHAKALLMALNPADQILLARRCVEENLNVRQAESLAQELNKGHKGPSHPKAAEHAPKRLDPDLAAVEQRLIGLLGTKVSIKGDASKGSILIEYFSSEDLDRIYEIING